MQPTWRFWEVDFLRGAAICLMVASNTVTDLQYFAGYADAPAFWFWFARATASLFLLLVGVSLTLSYSRAAAAGRADFAKYLRRGLWIFSWGLAITAVTRFFIGGDAVLFGVLHLIGLSIILAYPLIRRGLASLAAGLAALAAGLYLETVTFGFPWLLWLGLQPAGYRSVDYFPLLPWVGIIFLGIFAGSVLYRGGKRRFAMRTRENAATRALSFLGRHSLLIYLAHQPVILTALWAAGIIRL